MTLNEVVSPTANADAAMVARAHAYRAQANLGLDQPERARAAALLALQADPSLIVSSAHQWADIPHDSSSVRSPLTKAHPI